MIDGVKRGPEKGSPAGPGEMGVSFDGRGMMAEPQTAAGKRSPPRTKLTFRHVENCRLLPDRETLLDRLPRGAVAAEIGVAAGDYTAAILRHSEPRKLHLIDLWGSERYAPAFKNVESRFASEIDEGAVVIDRGRSVDVLARFPDAYFDWVYIDTDHSFETTFAELKLCHRTVKARGHIAGHDYCVGNVLRSLPYGVVEACAKFCVDFGWQFEFLTMESSGNPSFALMRL